MEHVFDLFEDDQELLKNIQRTADKMKPFRERIVAAENAVVDLHHHNWTDELFSDRFINKIRNRIDNGNIVYNKSTGLIVKTNVNPIPIKQWALQMNYAYGSDTKQPVLYHFDSPDYVVVILVKDCDDIGGQLVARDTNDPTDEKYINLKKAGDTIILHGKEVEHCVTQLQNKSSERITLIMSLVDIDNSPQNVQLDLVPNKINRHVIKDWLIHHVNFNTKTYDVLIGELLSKL